jgi:Mor family transcriptional regulator
MSIQPTRKAKPQPAAPLFHGQSSAHQQAAASDDFVCDVLALVADMVPGLDAEAARQVDAALRERWGGDRPYIARRLGDGRSDRNIAIRRDFQRGESIALLCRRYQLCSRQVLRILRIEDAQK